MTYVIRTPAEIMQSISSEWRAHTGAAPSGSVALMIELFAQELSLADQKVNEMVAMLDLDRPMGVPPDEWIAHRAPSAPNARCVPLPLGQIVTLTDPDDDEPYGWELATATDYARAAVKVQDLYDALPTPLPVAAAATRKPTARDLVRDAQRSSNGGRRGTAPCGHEGECEIGNYFRCLEGCDGEAVVVRDRAARKTQCLHRNTGLFHDPDNWSRTYRQRVRICLDCRERV